MPAVVDHEERRSELAGVAARLVAAGGAEAATVRAVARAAGYSTKVVSHYFDDKRALLLATYRFAAARSSAVTEATQAKRADVKAFVRALLPIEPAQRENWLIWYAFWGHAITDGDFTAEQRAQVDGTRARIAALVREDPRYRALGRAAAERAARGLLTEVIGVALQAVFDADYWTPARQRAAVETRLAELAADA